MGEPVAGQREAPLPMPREAQAAGKREAPFPPGDYPVVVVGSGPGGLQTSYHLRRLGIEHAVLSADQEPAGMFRRFPLFERLITWTKPYAPAERGTEEYEWYDWNSLLADRPEHRALVPMFMDGTSYFPARSEMEQGMTEFVRRTGLEVRYGCRWERTRRDDEGFVLETTDGEYRSRVAVIAAGMTRAWKPPVPGLEDVPHYVDTKPAREYEGKRVFIVGKRNSAFEVADALLPSARQVIIASPRPARLSITAHTTAAARARYLQPYEDHVLGGGTFVLDASIDRVERAAGGYRVAATGTTHPFELTLEVDEVIACTGFTAPLQDLRDLGVATFYQDRLPAQTPFWESATVPGIYFAGSISQGSVGLRKYGGTSNSASVHGFRYNARVLARHLAATHFGVELPRPAIEPAEVVGYLLSRTARAPELWNQQSYLARVVSFHPEDGIRDEGVAPLAHFVDAAGPNAVALAIETGPEGEIRPAAYVRRAGRVDEHLLPSHPLHDFETADHHEHLAALIKVLLE